MIGDSVIGGIELKAVAPVAAENLRRGAVVNQIAGVIGIESNRRVAAERRELVVDILPDGSLQRQHVEVVLLELVLAHFRRRIDRHAFQREQLRLIGVRGNLKMIDRRSRDQAQPRRRINEVREVSKEVALVAGVVNRRRPRRGRLDAAIGAQVLPRHEVAEVALRSAVLEARLRRSALPAVKIDVGQVVERAVLGLDIDDSGRAQAVFRRQRAGQQADRLGEARTQHLAETRDALGELDPVYPVLKIGVVAAHVQLPVRILRDAGRLQYHLVEGRVIALRQILDRLLGERILAPARVRRQGVARLVEPRRRDLEADRRLGFHRDHDRRGALGRDRHDRGRRLESRIGRDDCISAARCAERELARVVARRMSHHAPRRVLDRQRRVLDRSAERVFDHASHSMFRCCRTLHVSRYRRHAHSQLNQDPRKRDPQKQIPSHRKLPFFQALPRLSDASGAARIKSRAPVPIECVEKGA